MIFTLKHTNSHFFDTGLKILTPAPLVVLVTIFRYSDNFQVWGQRNSSRSHCPSCPAIHPHGALSVTSLLPLHRQRHQAISYKLQNEKVVRGECWSVLCDADFSHLFPPFPPAVHQLLPHCWMSRSAQPRFTKMFNMILNIQTLWCTHQFLDERKIKTNQEVLLSAGAVD